MSGQTFYIVDVFAETKYSGNQLAVVRNAAALSKKQMQQIAKEMNYSETTFILRDEQRENGYDVRIFTPASEVPFAGHPTLGTAFVIHREIAKKPVQKINLNLKVGQIPVTLQESGPNETILWMKQIEPEFGETLDSRILSDVLGIEPNQIDGRFPIQEVSTGLYAMIVPLKTLEAVKRIRVNLNKYYELIEKTTSKLILVFCPDTYHKENDLNVRVFGYYYQVPEDPATGSANGCLAGYLVKQRYFGNKKIDIRVEQGYEIGRPSLLHLRAEERNDKREVHVGGKVIMVAKGILT
jgi:trans-2,3-dihydro-3-hydroxyanthranilate isomerase